jgi:chromosome segregation ATPase
MSTKSLKKINEPVKDSKKVIAGFKGQIAKLKNQLIVTKEQTEVKELEINVFKHQIIKLKAEYEILLEQISTLASQNLENDKEIKKLKNDLILAHGDFDHVRLNYANERDGLVEKISKLEHENVQLIKVSNTSSFLNFKWLFK